MTIKGVKFLQNGTNTTIEQEIITTTANFIYELVLVYDI